MEDLPSVAAKSGDQHTFFRFRQRKTGVEADDRTEDGDGNACHDNCFDTRAQPYNKKRRQGGLRQGV